MGIARRGKGHIADGENNPAVGDAVEIHHLFGDLKKDPAVPRLHDLDRGPQPFDKGIVLNVVVDGLLSCPGYRVLRFVHEFASFAS